jgi:hypothetical protein
MQGGGMLGKSFLGCVENAASPARYRNLLWWRNAGARRRQIVKQVCEVSPQPQYIGGTHSKPGSAKKIFARQFDKTNLKTYEKNREN